METALAPTQLGFAHFIAQADGLAHFLLVVLLAMSVITWYLIVAKSIAHRSQEHRQLAHEEARAGFPGTLLECGLADGGG